MTKKNDKKSSAFDKLKIPKLSDDIKKLNGKSAKRLSDSLEALRDAILDDDKIKEVFHINTRSDNA